MEAALEGRRLPERVDATERPGHRLSRGPGLHCVRAHHSCRRLRLLLPATTTCFPTLAVAAATAGITATAAATTRTAAVSSCRLQLHGFPLLFELLPPVVCIRAALLAIIIHRVIGCIAATAKADLELIRRKEWSAEGVPPVDRETRTAYLHPCLHLLQARQLRREHFAEQHSDRGAAVTLEERAQVVENIWVTLTAERTQDEAPALGAFGGVDCGLAQQCIVSCACVRA